MALGTLADLAAALLLVQGDPQHLLSTLERDLLKAQRPGADRARIVREAKASFDRELRGAQVKSPKGVWDYYQDYVSRFASGARAFGNPDQHPERQAWMLACRETLLKQASQARKESFTSADLFADCVEAVGRARSRLPAENVDDLRHAAYESVNLLFRTLLRSCAPPKRDPKALHAGYLTTIGQKVGKSDDYAQRMLRDVAKACLDRDQAAP